MGVQTFHLYNASGQGIVLSYYVNGVNLTHTINAGEAYEFEADSLSPETQNAVQMGYLVYSQDSATVNAGNVKAGFPMIFRGNYYPTVKYQKGDLIVFTGSLWLCRADVYGQTPLDNTSAWVGFVTDLGGGNHQFDTNNPHNTTAAQVGAIALGEKGASDGVAPLVDGKVPSANLPASSVANGDTKLAEGTSNEVTAAALRLHIDSLANPHQTTPAQIGAIPTTAIGAVNGIPPLDAGGLIPAAYLPVAAGGTGLAPVYAVASNTLRDALIGSLAVGSLVAVLSPAKVWRWSGTAFTDVTSTSLWTFFVNGKSGPAVSLTTNDIAEASGKFYFTDARLAGSTAFATVQAASHAINSDTKLANGTGNEVTAAQLKAHLISTSNPHNVTASQIGALTAIAHDVAPTLGNAMDAGSYRIFNMGTPVQNSDAATKAYVDAIATIAIGGGVLTVNGRGGAVTLSIADVAATASALRAAITGTSGTGNLLFSTGGLISEYLATDCTFNGNLTSVQAGKIQGTCQTLNVAELVSNAVLTSGTYVWSAANGGFSRTVLTANGIVGFPTNAKDGCTYTVLLVQGGSGGYTVTWHADFIFNGSAPTLKTGVGQADSFQFSCYGGKLYCTSHGGTSGGFRTGAAVVDVDTVLTNAQSAVSVDAGGGDIDITLPSAVGNAGKVFIISKYDATSNVVNILSSDYLNGTLGETFLEEQFQSIIVQAVGGEWIIVASNGFGGATPDVYAFFDSGSHVLTSETVISVEASGAPVNLELPAVATVVGIPITIQRTKGGTSAPALVAPASGEAIEDYFSGLIPVNLGESITFFSNGTVWKVIHNLVNAMRITGDQYIQDEKTFTNLKAETLKADGFSTGVTILTANTTVDLEMTALDVSAAIASFTVTLPDPTTCSGKLYTIFRSDTTSFRYVRILSPVGNIEDLPHFDLLAPWEGLVIQAVNGKWRIISANLTNLRRKALDECTANSFLTFNGQTGFGIGNDATTNADYPHVRNANAGTSVKYTADGGSANIDVTIEGKGTGVARAATATLGTNTTQIASTAFVNSAVAAAVNGLSWKGICRAATTANVNLASALINAAVIDGVTLVTGDRVLVKDQTAPAENGIYIVAASGAASRATDADTGTKLVNASVYVSEGSVAADKQYTCTTNAPITLGSTAVTFTNFASGITYLNGTGILLTGVTFSIDTAVVLDLTTAQTASNKTFSSVTLTGTPVAPTATLGANTTQVATTAFVKAALDAADLDAVLAARLAFSTAARVAITGSVSLSNATHDGKQLRCSSASAAVLTIENTVRDGFSAIVHQDGAGVFSIASTTLTIRNADGVVSTGGQWTSLFVERKGSDLIVSGTAASTGSTLNEISLLNMIRLTVSAAAYVEITASRAVTDADNGKILYSTSASVFTLTYPDTLTKPFSTPLHQDGTGALLVAVSGAHALRNRNGHARTAGQWARAAVDIRAGVNDVVLNGDTTV